MSGVEFVCVARGGIGVSVDCDTGYRLGISYTCTALRFKPAFIATW